MSILVKRSSVGWRMTIITGLILTWIIYYNGPFPVDQIYFSKQSEPLEIEPLIYALASGSIPTEEEIMAWELLLHRLKSQIDAGIPLSEEQIEQLQRLYDLTSAYVPWLENFFELLKNLIQHITLSNAALEIDLHNQANNDSDE